MPAPNTFLGLSPPSPRIKKLCKKNNSALACGPAYPHYTVYSMSLVAKKIPPREDAILCDKYDPRRDLNNGIKRCQFIALYPPSTPPSVPGPLLNSGLVYSLLQQFPQNPYNSSSESWGGRGGDQMSQLAFRLYSTQYSSSGFHSKHSYTYSYINILLLSH